MLFKRRDVTLLAGVSTVRVFYVIKDVLRSVTRETQQSVIRAIEERLYLPGAIGRSLVAKTDFIGFNFPNILKPIHARRPELSKRLARTMIHYVRWAGY
jgi:DNA-binding LacI/PurR family transcriptional regulator